MEDPSEIYIILPSEHLFYKRESIENMLKLHLTQTLIMLSREFLKTEIRKLNDSKEEGATFKSVQQTGFSKRVVINQHD